jgi:hypothetical protein
VDRTKERPSRGQVHSCSPRLLHNHLAQWSGMLLSGGRPDRSPGYVLPAVCMSVDQMLNPAITSVSLLLNGADEMSACL